jgi:hypothetical protein
MMFCSPRLQLHRSSKEVGSGMHQKRRGAVTLRTTPSLPSGCFRRNWKNWKNGKSPFRQGYPMGAALRTSCRLCACGEHARSPVFGWFHGLARRITGTRRTFFRRSSESSPQSPHWHLPFNLLKGGVRGEASTVRYLYIRW